MNMRSLLSVAAIVSAMTLPAAVTAQEDHMIGGKAVPADQVAEVQAKCDELRAAQPAADAGAAETPAEAEPSSDADAASVANEGWTEDGTRIDLEKLTVALCDAGNFTATAQ